MPLIFLQVRRLVVKVRAAGEASWRLPMVCTTGSLLSSNNVLEGTSSSLKLDFGCCLVARPWMRFTKEDVEGRETDVRNTRGGGGGRTGSALRS